MQMNIWIKLMWNFGQKVMFLFVEIKWKVSGLLKVENGLEM